MIRECDIQVGRIVRMNRAYYFISSVHFDKKIPEFSYFEINSTINPYICSKIPIYSTKREPCLDVRYPSIPIFVGDDVIYTCGRQRVINRDGAWAIGSGLSPYVTIHKLFEQIEEGDVAKIIRNKEIIYMKETKFPEWKSGRLVKFKDGILAREAYDGIKFYAYDIETRQIRILSGKYDTDGQTTDRTECEFDIMEVYEFTPIGSGREPNLIWRAPDNVALSMQEIADKFGIPVEKLKIKK